MEHTADEDEHRVTNPAAPSSEAFVRQRSFHHADNQNDYFSPISTATSSNPAIHTYANHNSDAPSTPLVTSPTVFGLSNRSLEGVVTVEATAVPQRSKYAGKISTQVLAKSAEELFQDEEIRIRVMEFFCPLMSFAEDISMPLSTFYPTVRKDIADRHVEAYFTSIKSMFPVLSRGDFIPLYEEFYHSGHSTNAVFVCSLYMVMALGSRKDGGSGDSNDLFAAGWELYSRVISTPYLPSVQALLLMALELMHGNKDGQASLAVGTAVRIAQSLGLHRRLAAHKHPWERGFVEREYNLRTRIWWVCYCLDKKLAFETGRPSAINDIECDVDSPRNMALTPGSATSSEDENFLDNLVELCRIQSNIISRLFCRPIIQDQDCSLMGEIEALDEQLLTWKERLPSAVRIDEQLAGMQSSAISIKFVLLHCMYYNTMLVIHRAALFGEAPLEPHQRAQLRMMAADVVCLNSARSLAQTVNGLVSTPYSWPIVRLTTSYILNVLFTLYIGIMKNPAQWTSESDIALIKTLPNCFSKGNSTPFAISSFDKLCTSLIGAITVMRRRSLAVPKAAADIELRPEHSDFEGNRVETMSEEEINQEMDFRFGDFFGLCGNADPLLSMQMWPVSLDQTTDGVEFFTSQ
ncbi:hypothetical protein N7520_006846 [Penicillium odoratum]|uniref:uncharacterized protein n=1 Tax=Penicillium odoratum TaxID=1167516 RepID=UPI002548719A|nr:uncharacterized protein N7520_006846 [Penicillium odoratum]KAJ5759690.1 hypothetical protein N7520_006846 [Penicillium odoratum]